MLFFVEPPVADPGFLRPGGVNPIILTNFSQKVHEIK